MRLKHVFVLAPLLWFVAIAGAADTQLKDISVSAQGSATAVTLETAGPFTHSEYRPQATMVLVDLQKVSSVALKQRQRTLDSPAVKSYRVLEYKSVGGVEVTRLELTVTDATKLQVKETKNGLQLLFTTGAASAASAATPPPAKAAAAAVKPATPVAPVKSAATPATAVKSTPPKPAAAAPAKAVSPTEAASLPPVTIRNVGVLRTSAGIAVEIEGAKTAKTLRLSDPERLVLDIENAILASKQTIAVDGADLKTVRVAQFQASPPITRVVLDLAGPREFDLANRGNKLVVIVLPPKAAAPAATTLTPPAPVEVAAPAAAPLTPPAPKEEATATLAQPAPNDIKAAPLPALRPAVHPVGDAFPDQTVVSVVGEKAAARVKDPPAKAAVDAGPAQQAAPAPAPQAVALVQNNDPREAPAKLVPTTLSDPREKPSAIQKSADYVYVSPEFKKQDTSSALASVDPASTRVVEAATTVAQTQPPPALNAQPQPEPAPSTQAQTQTPELAANPASTHAVEAPTAVAQPQPPPALNAQPQPEPAPSTQAQTQTPEPAANPASTRAIEAATTVAQTQPPPAPNAQPQLPPPTTPQPAANLALEQQKAIANPTPPPPAKVYTGEPISVNLKDVDIKDFFRLIHEISGLNIVLDPNVRGSLTLVLDDVPWDQALDVVLRNNGLGRELEGNILRIAALDTFRKEAEEQRARTDAQALAVSKITVTRFLSYGRAKDVMPTIKKLLSPRGEVLADDRTNALIINDIPSNIPGFDRLITQLDRKTMQVEIEARVVSATRNFAQQLGTQLGFAWGNGNTSVGGNPTNGYSTQTYTSSTGSFPYFTSNGTIPLFSNQGLTSSTGGLAFSTAVGNYRVDVLLSAAESRGLAKVLSRPRVVTQNNVTAVVRQGYQIPIVTQSQLGGPATTSYINAFLRLTVTPQITIENTIFLAVDVENTTPDFGNSSTSVGGNPSLLTQQATTQVLVSDGGTVVIGGVIQTSSSVNTSQVPLLGNIPLLGNLFKSRSVSTSTQELIFIICPKIVQT
jgi:type IV pilus assembly protein PilQ